MSYKRGLMLNPVDNVANVLEEVLPGDIIQLNLNNEILTINAKELIPFGFKVAVKEIIYDSPIIKYGHRIGLASQPIKQGTLVHIHNLAGVRGRGDLTKKT
jgi:altronate dehydratase small subunit